MALELYHSPYRLTMYYQGLLSLMAPSQMMICGTLTLRYLFRIVLSGAVAKGEDFITSGSVTRQGVTVVMTGGWDKVQLPISANNYFAIASPITPTTNYNGGGADVPVSVRSVNPNSMIIALPGARNQWKASILIIGTV